MTDDKEICGHTGTHNGEPCQHPTTDEGDPDRCYIDAHNEADVPDERQPGPPSKLPDVREDILEAARDGLAKEACANAAGIHKSTLFEWVDEDSEYYHEEFAADWRQARAEGERTLVKGGLYDDDVDSTMAKFVLATSFGRTKTERREVDASHEHTGDGGGPIEVTVKRERYEPDE